MVCIHTSDKQLASGYGYRWITRDGEGRSILSHRIAYAESKGTHPFDLPRDLVIRHSCDNPWCINLLHLSEGTHQDNTNDKVSRKRQSKGESTGQARLTEQQAMKILAEQTGSWGEQTQLAIQYGVSQQTISKLLSGETWKHLLR